MHSPSKSGFNHDKTANPLPIAAIKKYILAEGILLWDSLVNTCIYKHRTHNFGTFVSELTVYMPLDPLFTFGYSIYPWKGEKLTCEIHRLCTYAEIHVHTCSTSTCSSVVKHKNKVLNLPKRHFSVGVPIPAWMRDCSSETR